MSELPAPRPVPVQALLKMTSHPPHYLTLYPARTFAPSSFYFSTPFHSLQAKNCNTVVAYLVACH